MSVSLLKVLIVDDSDLITSVMKRFFEDYNFNVLTCSDGLRGIKFAVEEKPDVIFLDLSMPNIDGYDTLKVLKSLQETKNIPVIIITAHSDNKSISEALKLGAAKVIIKPISKKTIVTELENLLGQPLLTRIKTQKYFGTETKEISNSNSDYTPQSSIQILSSKIKKFIKSIDERSNEISGYLEVKNYNQLKNSVYELIGYGNELGYPRLANLSDYIHRLLSKNENELDWKEIEDSTNKLLSYLKEIKIF